MKLDDDIIEAMRKMERMEEIEKKLPGYDCGSCGSPTCRALAEDIVRGYTTDDACIVKFKEKIMHFASDIMSIEAKNNEVEQ